METFLKELPTVASHPFALLGYVAIAGVWLAIALQARRPRSQGRRFILPGAALTLLMIVVLVAFAFARAREIELQNEEQRKAEILIALAQDASLFERKMRRAEELAAMLKPVAEQTKTGRSPDVELDEEFQRLRGDIDSIFAGLKKQFESIKLVYKSKDVTAAIDEVARWWDTEVEPRKRAVDAAPASEAHTKLNDVLLAMKAELNSK